MLKRDLESQNTLLNRKIWVMRETLTEIRQLARDFIPKGSVINNVWLIEKTTETLTKVQEMK